MNPLPAFRAGMMRIELDNGGAFLIATPIIIDSGPKKYLLYWTPIILKLSPQG
jgi:hypothetical protein